jgi:hypothetical protein
VLRHLRVGNSPETLAQAGERCDVSHRQSSEKVAATAHACRDGEVLCGRVELTVRTDTRLGLTARERRRFAARFVEHLHPALRDELNGLVDRRGAAARRAAECIEPIELVFDDPRLGLQRIVGQIEPPQHRRRDLHEIQFGLREPTP